MIQCEAEVVANLSAFRLSLEHREFIKLSLDPETQKKGGFIARIVQNQR